MRAQRDQVTLSRKERKRLKLLNDIEAETTTTQPVLVGERPRSQLGG
ncbi:MAG: hypothetical protein ACC700_19045 [Anaerolineales bacterium]